MHKNNQARFERSIYTRSLAPETVHQVCTCNQLRRQSALPVALISHAWHYRVLPGLHRGTRSKKRASSRGSDTRSSLSYRCLSDAAGLGWLRQCAALLENISEGIITMEAPALERRKRRNFSSCRNTMPCHVRSCHVMSSTASSLHQNPCKKCPQTHELFLTQVRTD